MPKSGARARPPAASAPSRSGWACPRCGRRFTKRTREHSCDLTPLEQHLERGSDEVRATFAALERLLRRIGEHRIVPLKTMMSIAAVKNFAGLTIGRSRLDLGFFLDRPLASPRVCRTERISPRKIAYHVHLASPADVDAELEEWLRESHRLGSQHAPE